MPLQAVTAGRFSQRIWTALKGTKRIMKPLYGVKLYEARPQADGRWTWRLVQVVGEPFSGWNTVCRAAQEYAQQNNLPYLPELKHGDRMTQVIQ